MEGVNKKRRVELFFENQISVHITTLDEKFYNGMIVQMGSDFFLIEDRFLGETFVLYEDIDEIEPYKEREER